MAFYLKHAILEYEYSIQNITEGAEFYIMNWRTILKSFKNRDMQKRVGIVLGIIVAYRFLAHIPVPLTEPTKLKSVVDSIIGSTDFGGFLNLLTGGSLANFSIILVGLGPFITASIVMQLLTRAIPQMEQLHKDGESGRKRINQWTRLASLPLAIIQSFTLIYVIRQQALAGNTTGALNTSLTEWIVAVLAMTAGAMLLMWLGELMTEQGIGNGISLLIFAGIISQMPQITGGLINSLFNVQGQPLNIFGWFQLPVNASMAYIILALLAISFIALYLLVKVNEAQRIITVNYAKRVNSNSAYGGIKSILPVKLIVAGVIPIIFALSFLSIPALIGQLMKAMGDPSQLEIANNLISWFNAPTFSAYQNNDASALIYPAAYFVLVILFTYFYTGIAFNTNEVSENLQKQGGFIEGVRPGEHTEKYLKTVVTRLILFGSLILGFVSVMPFMVEYVLAQFGVRIEGLAVGGTGLLIVVSVGLETMRQLNSRALMVTYDDYK